MLGVSCFRKSIAAFLLIITFLFINSCKADDFSETSDAAPQTGDSWFQARQGEQVTVPFVGELAPPSGELTVTLESGKYFHQGDMLIAVASDGGFALQSDGTRDAVGIRGRGTRWANGTVPYVIAAGYPDTSVITRAMQHWTSKTNGLIRFKQRTNESDYIYIIDGSGCYSYVGRQGGKQDVSLAYPGCRHAGVHELGHALGMYHEQNHPGRDQVVDIHWNEICDENAYNFQISSNAESVTSYDFGSVMHYDSYAFSCTGRPTMTVKAAHQSRNGRSQYIKDRSTLSSSDIAGIQKMYGGSSGGSGNGTGGGTGGTGTGGSGGSSGGGTGGDTGGGTGGTVRATANVALREQSGEYWIYQITPKATSGKGKTLVRAEYNLHETFTPFTCPGAEDCTGTAAKISTWSECWSTGAGRGVTLHFQDGSTASVENLEICSR